MDEIKECDVKLYNKYKKEMNAAKKQIKTYEKQIIKDVNKQYSEEELEIIANVDLMNRKLNEIAILTIILSLFSIFFTTMFALALLQSYFNDNMAKVPIIVGFAIFGCGVIISGILLHKKSKFEKMLEGIEEE